MKPALEQIAYEKSRQSFQFFNFKTDAFKPFWHYHPELELTLITKGNGTRFIGDSIEPFSDFDLILVGENLPHNWVSTHELGDAQSEAYVFQFNKDLFGQFAECGVFETLFHEAALGIHYSNPSHQLIEKITSFASKSKVLQLATFIEILQILVGEEPRRILSSNNNQTKYHHLSTLDKISKTTNYILEHLDQKLTVNHMSKLTNMVPQSFCRWFKNHAGHTFVSFLNQSRVQRAGQLLESSNMQIQEIAFSCGFESLSHFNRTFKKFQKKSPSEFRRRSS
ncbi:MAG: hypothetical protein COA50_10165 [Flavobacteriaceae bacterium]|nr:MAG: hypothetical protein COA50_10165 [Flavobacteriaceae bacterium]